jgi:signal transduction protein with GAF and PtsI domain
VPLIDRGVLQGVLVVQTKEARIFQPGNSLGTVTFGVVSSTGNYLSRNIQIALKLLF